MDIVIIGTGNTASILGRKLKDAGHHIIQVYGRDANSASELAYVLDTESTNYWSVVSRSADIYLIAVNDIAIEEVVKELQLPAKTLIHTAASVSKDILKRSSNHFGVFYPLQSLNKAIDHLPDTPIIIDASDKETLQELQNLAYSISDQVITATEDDRLKLHLAAVFCNNFVNHFYVLIEDYCTKENLDFHILLPLIEETSTRIKNISPRECQTGPAKRNDHETIQKHLNMLSKYPEMKDLYQVMTKSIQSLH